MYTPRLFKYIIPVNPAVEGETQTVDVVQIYGSATERCSLLRRYLKHTYAMSRKQANAAIVALGFDDLIPDEQPRAN